MFAAALLATLLVSAQPEPMGPISVADLPRPTPGPDGPNVNFNFRCWWIPVSAEECRQKALAALSLQEGFCFAEIDASGHVVGYTRTTRIVVLIDSGSDGSTSENSYVVVMTADRLSQTNNKGAQEVFDQVVRTQASPQKMNQVGKPNSELEKRLLPIAWSLERKPADTRYELFPGVGALVLYRRGFTFVAPIPTLLIASRSERPLERLLGNRVYRPVIETPVMQAFLPKREPAGDIKQMCVVHVGGGIKGKTTNIYFLSTGNHLDPQRAVEEFQSMMATIIKLLFE